MKEVTAKTKAEVETIMTRIRDTEEQEAKRKEGDEKKLRTGNPTEGVSKESDTERHYEERRVKDVETLREAQLHFQSVQDGAARRWRLLN